MACSKSGKAAPFVLALILLSALAYDSQQSNRHNKQPENPPPGGRDEHAEARHGQD
jgi:hypothetical protein